jgi:hypothetical protein
MSSQDHTKISYMPPQYLVLYLNLQEEYKNQNPTKDMSHQEII